MENENIKCLLADDEQAGLDILESILQTNRGVDVIGKVSNPEKVISEIIEKEPDLVFLDINMPNKSGIDLLKEINSLNINVKVIFVTAFDDYAIEALKNDAFDYLVKPIDRGDLNTALFKYKNTVKKSDQLNTTEFDKIKIPVNYGSLFFNYDDIVYLEADGSYTKIVLSDNKEEITSVNIGKLESKLHSANFFRASRSLIINLKYLSKLDRKTKTCTLLSGGNEYNLVVPKNKIHLIDEQLS